MKICVDTTVLIDILKNEFPAYQDMLYFALEKNEDLAAPTVVYAELLPQFRGDIKLLNSFLKEHRIKIEPLDIESVSIAGQRWMKYLKRKSKIQCPQCGYLLDTKEHFFVRFLYWRLCINKV